MADWGVASAVGGRTAGPRGAACAVREVTARSGPRADAIVVAAGGSTRMGGIDKLLAPVGGRPLLERTLGAIAASTTVDRIVVVTAPARVAELAAVPWLPPSVVTVVAGGPDRETSVAAGLDALDALDALDEEATPSDPDRVVLVHEGRAPWSHRRSWTPSCSRPPSTVPPSPSCRWPRP